MFLKTTKTKYYEYLSLAESYWENGSSHHRIADIPVQEEGVIVPFDCSEAHMKNYGYLAYAQLWEELGIAR